jgi:hypothetical protein
MFQRAWMKEKTRSLHSERLDCDGNVYGRDPLNLPSDLLTA